MTGNENTHTSTAVGRAVFKAGDKTVTVAFSTFTELEDKEDDLTWDHWPTELVMVSVEYSDGSDHRAG